MPPRDEGIFADADYPTTARRNVIIEREEPGGGEVVLTLEIEDERLEKHIDIASKRVSQRVNIPGFRKGKAPKSILINHLGRDYLVEESMRSLVPEAVDEAVEEQALEPWAVPQVDIEEVEPTVKLRARVPLRPSVEMSDYRAIRFEDQPESITDDQVNEMLERIRQAYGVTRTVERAAQAGDVIVFSGNASIGDDNLFDVQDREFMLDPDNHIGINGFVDSLIGIVPGEARDFKGTFESRAHGDEADEGSDAEDGSEAENQETSEERVAEVHVEVSEVKEVVLPDLDDDLAKTYGNEDIQTLDALRQHIRDGMESESELRLTRELEVKVLEQLVESSQFEISPIIVEREGRRLLDFEVQRRHIMMGGRGPKLRPEDIQPESYEAAEQAAEANLKRRLVIEKLAELEQIEVSDEDVQSEVDTFNEQARASEMQPFDDTENNRESIRDDLRGRRTLDLAVRLARGLGSDD